MIHTIVLVHGALADSSGWSLVAAACRRRDTRPGVREPTADVQYDSAYLRSVLDSIPGPIVLVAHSYGGAVAANASTGDHDVRPLEYVAAYALDEGEAVQQANMLGGGQTNLGAHLIIRPFPGASPGDADATIDPAFFRELFAQDLPRAVTAGMAASQRPAALGIPSGVPGWKSIPSWYMVAKQDRTNPTTAERMMAPRGGGGRPQAR
jgi:pimeloyl-ACP methyl ester carboxylesterase